MPPELPTVDVPEPRVPRLAARAKTLQDVGRDLISEGTRASDDPRYGAQKLAAATKGFSCITPSRIIETLLALHDEQGLATTTSVPGLGQSPVVWSFQFGQDRPLLEMARSLRAAMSSSAARELNRRIGEAMKNPVRHPEQDGDFARRSYIVYAMSKVLDPKRFAAGEADHNAKVFADLAGINIIKTFGQAVAESALLASNPLTLLAAGLPYLRLLDSRQTLPHQTPHGEGALAMLREGRPIDAFYYSFNLDPADPDDH